MAVEATHLNLFPPQQQQQIMLNPNMLSTNGLSYNNNTQQQQMLQFPHLMPMSIPMQANLVPVHHHTLVCDSVDSGLTFNDNTRKRSRDSFKPQIVSSFVGDDVLLPVVQQHQLDINSIISNHTKKIRLELEEQQKQQARMLVSAIGEKVMKKLNEKDEEIQRMGKLNLVLQERVKSLCVENQLWRDLAHTNEAAANTLRNNLEQVLAAAHVSANDAANVRHPAPAADVADDAESCCGSSDGVANEDDVVESGEGRTLAGEAQDKRVCRRCGERESCVLLLPCRHLCLCTVCGSSLVQACPVCNSNMNATVHVNLSS